MLPCARAQPDVLTEAHYDVDALSRAWAARMGRDQVEVRPTVEALVREGPTCIPSARPTSCVATRRRWASRRWRRWCSASATASISSAR
eukprot:3573928-Prymnesium_polylepis.1